MEESDRLPALQVIVLGSGGGPDETNTTAFLVRSIALQWKPGSMIAVDAGVQVGAITSQFERTIQRANAKSTSENKENYDSSPFGSSDSTRITIGTVLDDGPFKGFECQAQTAGANAAYVMQRLIRTIVITHAHLDHVAAIAINSPLLFSTPGQITKVIAGLPSTICAIKDHIFNDLIWPNLSNESKGPGHPEGPGFFHYLRLKDGGDDPQGEMTDTAYVEVCEGLSIFPRSVSHGACKAESPGECDSVNNTSSNVYNCFPSDIIASLVFGFRWVLEILCSVFRTDKSTTKTSYNSSYESTAYFIRDNGSGSEVLIFGDIEPDSLSHDPKNERIWSDAAVKFRSGALKAVFIECSYDSAQVGDLYGHMNPPYIIEELQVLAELVCPNWKTTKKVRHIKALSDSTNGSNTVPTEKGPLCGLTVVIIHMKEKMNDGPGMNVVIRQELKALEDVACLGCEFVISEPGMSLEF